MTHHILWITHYAPSVLWMTHPILWMPHNILWMTHHISWITPHISWMTHHNLLMTPHNLLMTPHNLWMTITYVSIMNNSSYLMCARRGSLCLCQKTQADREYRWRRGVVVCLCCVLCVCARERECEREMTMMCSWTHWYVGHYSFICATWLVYMWRGLSPTCDRAR